MAENAVNDTGIKHIWDKGMGRIESTQSVSGNPVTIANAAPINAEDITVDITPVQDLHGYDKPWAGGAGKNKLPMTVDGIKAVNTSGTWNGNTYSYGGVDFEILTDSAGSVIGIKANGTAIADWIVFDMPTASLKADSYKVTGIDSGSVSSYRISYQVTGETEVTFYSGESAFTLATDNTVYVKLIIRLAGYTANNVFFYPMIRLATETDATFAPYSNICPIEGWTGAELDRVGKNWFDLINSTGTKTNSGITSVSNGDGTFKISGKSTTTTHINIWLLGDYNLTYPLFTLKAGTYTISDIMLFRKTSAISGDTYIGDSSTFTLSEDTEITGVRMGEAVVNQDYDLTIHPQLELGTQATAYEPYQGQQYTASFGETVHGGKWHVTEGGTDKTYGCVEFDGSDDEQIVIVDRGNRASLMCNGAKQPISPSAISGLLSNEFKTVSNIDTYHGRQGISQDGGRIFVSDGTGSMNLVDFKAFLSNNPLQVVYELATPTTISTPKQNVPMLQGINTVSADCGDTSLKYQPDNVIGELKGEIEGKLDTINNAGFHNSIYRGKFLGNEVSPQQYQAINNGTFDDMYIGDYWTLSTTIGGTTSNVKYVIAGFDYWWNCGDSYPQSSNKHHIVLVPESSLYNAKMNDSNITTGGYVGSKMYTDYLANARTGISTLFGNHLYSVRRLFTNAVNTAGQAINWNWYISSVDLMNETMAYGYTVWTTSGFEVGVDRTILPLFALNPTSASIRADWWLRSVVTSSCFAFVGGDGRAYCYNASYSLGVRPAFAIY